MLTLAQGQNIKVSVSVSTLAICSVQYAEGLPLFL